MFAAKPSCRVPERCTDRKIITTPLHQLPPPRIPPRFQSRARLMPLPPERRTRNENAQSRVASYHFDWRVRHLATPEPCPRDRPARQNGRALWSVGLPCVDAHVIPWACAHVIPQVVDPGDVLLGGLLPVVGDTPGALVRAVAGSVHEDLMAGVDQSVEERLGDHRVGEQRVPVDRGPVAGQDH
jgi:hypothetical protein